nr:helix-turn-helix domain-containing protein [Salinigranum marinum]
MRTTSVGRQKLVTLSEIEPVEQLEALITEYGHVDFAELVAGSGLQLLYYLDRRRTATELTELSDLSRATVYRRLNDLQAVGVIGKSKSHYLLNEPFSSLSSIARGLAHHEHRREAERYADGVNILWETHEEYLIACDSEISDDGFHLTGPSLFAEYGIPLLTRSRQHYFRSDRITAVSPAELVCHTLLIDDGSRYRTYSLLLIQKEAIEQAPLKECAEYYDPEADIDLLAIVDKLVEYLDSKGAVTSDRLPAWEEFKSTATDYEINV